MPIIESLVGLDLDIELEEEGNLAGIYRGIVEAKHMHTDKYDRIDKESPTLLRGRYSVFVHPIPIHM